MEEEVTSIAFEGKTNFYAATHHSTLYNIDADFNAQKLFTCHYSPVNDVCFPEASDALFATASDNDIRLWNAETSEQLLRIVVPNVECKSIIFNKTGSSLISGWSDGKIRAFGPQSGRLQFVMHDVHKGCVTALAVTDTYNENLDYRIVTGGDDGEVRVWRITREKQMLENGMKEHKGGVSCIQIRKNNLECVSASADGSCIIWDLNRFVRNQVMFAPSFFRAVAYCPDESQILTSGSDRKIAYWEVYDASLIRELDGSQSDSINGLDITKDGNHFVIGGGDKLVKVYKYEEGDVEAIGHGHSASISQVKFGRNLIVSVSEDGAVFVWKFPQ